LREEDHAHHDYREPELVGVEGAVGANVPVGEHGQYQGRYHQQVHYGQQLLPPYPGYRAEQLGLVEAERRQQYREREPILVEPHPHERPGEEEEYHRHIRGGAEAPADGRPGQVDGRGDDGGGRDRDRQDRNAPAHLIEERAGVPKEGDEYRGPEPHGDPGAAYLPVLVDQPDYGAHRDGYQHGIERRHHARSSDALGI
jgi:hypothetical protein